MTRIEDAADRRSSTAASRLLAASINKLASIVEIVKFESAALGGQLRAVVLADLIRRREMPQQADDERDFQQLGVVPIFEALRRADLPGVRLGILSGSLVVVPVSALPALTTAARAAGFGESQVVAGELPHTTEFCSVTFLGAANEKVVAVITRLFGAGEITALVGTKSLLGEGWDAPSVNCLVLASVVGSYMLSNQMRGRAIRTDPSQPEKTANIWHLVTVDPNWIPGEDFEALERRFRCFMGVAHNRQVIEGGFERLAIGDPPFSRERVAGINEEMRDRALNRDALRRQWRESLQGGAQPVDALETPASLLPRNFVLSNTLVALLWQGAMMGLYVFFSVLQSARGDVLLWALLVASVIGTLVALPKSLKAVWLFLRHGSLERSLRQVGDALLQALYRARAIEKSERKLQVRSAAAEHGTVRCWLEGSTSYEQSLFLNALREVLDPVANPRYMICRSSPWLFVRREDFHAVPEVLGRKKEYAEFFLQMWRKRVGEAKLIYTRSVDGRKALLRARGRSLAAAFQARSQRRSCWK